MTRGPVPDDYIQNYAVVIEVSDEKGKVNVYDEVKREYGELYLPFTQTKAA